MRMERQVLFIQGADSETHDEWDGKLVDSLRRELGRDYEIHYPRMPDEADPNAESWKRAISSELSKLSGNIVLVGRSIGGSILLKYLAEEKIEKPVAGLFLLAAIPHIFLYHSRDDEVVPLTHLALHGAKLPQAIIREVGGGHQFGNDLTYVAKDITTLEEVL